MYKKLLKLTGLSLVVLTFIVHSPNLNIEMLGDYGAIIGWLVIASIVATIYKSGKFIINKINE